VAHLRRAKENKASDFGEGNAASFLLVTQPTERWSALRLKYNLQQPGACHELMVNV